MPERQQWVFLNRCGCATGVMEYAGQTRADAWAEFYDGVPTRGFESGKSLHLVEHGRYVAEFMPMMRSTYRCPHGDTS
jgi:hypothetical protein